jgi:hypothetical protein
MKSPEISPAAETGAVKPAVKRPAGKGKPPPPGNTLDALGAAPAAVPEKQAAPEKKKAKDKAAKAPSKERTEPLNFRVTADFRRAFKRAAAAQDCKKVELLERMFTEWSARNPG